MEIGSDAGNVFSRASSCANSRRLRSSPISWSSTDLRLRARISSLRHIGSACAGRGAPDQRLNEIQRERKHDRGAALAGDVEQRCEVAQLHRLRDRRQYARGVEQFLRGLLLPLGIDNFGTARALGLGLTGDCPDHALVEIDALDLDGRDLDAPRLGLLVEHVLDIGVELVALCQHLVEIVLAQDPAQRRLRELAGRRQIVADLDHRALGIDDPEVEHGVDLHRDIVARNDVLRGHFVHYHWQIDAHHLLHERDKKKKSWSLGAGVASQREHHAAFVFAQDANGRIQNRQHQNHQSDNDRSGKHGSSSLSCEMKRQAGVTTRTRPSRSMTLTRVPGSSAPLDRARQISPLTRTRPSSPSHASASPSAPTSASLPVTTGRLRDRNSIASTSSKSAAVSTVAATTTGSARLNPGAPEGNMMIAPMTKAAMPPTPITPNDPM